MSMSPKSEANLAVIENFILYLTHCSEGDTIGSDEEMSFTPNQMYQKARDYIDEDHVDGEEAEHANGE